MMSFPFRRNTPPPRAVQPVDDKPGADSALDDSAITPPSAELRGWFDSSADLKGGLQVQEEDFDSLPADIRDAFPSR